MLDVEYSLIQEEKMEVTSIYVIISGPVRISLLPADEVFTFYTDATDISGSNE